MVTTVLTIYSGLVLTWAIILGLGFAAALHNINDGRL